MSVLDSFSDNGAHHSADNRTDGSCEATNCRSGDSASSLFRDRRNFYLFMFSHVGVMRHRSQSSFIF